MSIVIPELQRSYAGENTFELKTPEITLSGTGYVCLIGTNGSGKSSFGDALAESPLGANEDKWYYLPQHLDRFLFAEHVLEQLSTMLAQEIDRQALISLISDMGFKDAETMLEFPFLLMSGGERRRMALVCVFYLQPSRLILDEPEIGVTAKENMVLLSKLHNLTASHVQIIMISHNHDIVRHSSDLICLDSGKVDRVGQTGELLADPLFEIKKYGVRFT